MFDTQKTLSKKNLYSAMNHGHNKKTHFTRSINDFHTKKESIQYTFFPTKKSH